MVLVELLRNRVAVEVEGAGGFEDAMEFDEARGHHGEVGHHRRGFEELFQRLDQFDDAGVGAGVNELVIGGVHVGGPFPRVGEGVELGLAVRAAGFLEQDVVVGVGVEGRIEIFEINASVGEKVLVAQPTQIVAEE